MDIDKLREILSEKKILLKENYKNLICKCCYCGDHREQRKWGHLWVSKFDNIPVAHCWLCQKAVTINTLVKDLTGDRELSELIVDKETLERYKSKSTDINFRHRNLLKFKLPEITDTSYMNKQLYLRSRTNNQIDVKDIPNIIVNFAEFFSMNKLKLVGESISNQEFDLLQSNFVGFLTENHTLLLCRNCDNSAKFAFRKIPLQIDPLNLIDFWKIPGMDPNSDSLLLAEGPFDVLGEFVSDSLHKKDRSRAYACPGTFSYANLLKSICFNESVFQADVTILGDQDKPEWMYRKFLKENAHVIRKCEVFNNSAGKDFGVFPQRPVKIK